MKKLILFAILMYGVLLSACGGGGGDSSTGLLSASITDARPVLPAGIQRVMVTIDEVSVHKSGGGWISLPLAQTPFTIDLLQFTDGQTTQLVPQVELTSGKYTQVRLGVQSATIVTDDETEIPVEIDPKDLKTDKNFDFDVQGGGGVALTVDFDLSQSIVATGSDTFKLKPVLHLVSTAEAATITGSISTAAYGDENQATIIVTQDRDNSGSLTEGDVEYTRLVVDKGTTGDPTLFSIYWLVPNQSYIVDIQIGSTTYPTQAVANTDLPPTGGHTLDSI